MPAVGRRGLAALLVPAVVVAVVALGASLTPGGRRSVRGVRLPSPAESACALPRDVLVRIWRGYHPVRGPDVLIVPREPNFLDGGISHSGPWDYLQEVPMVWYGPGHVAAGRVVGRPVTAADIAPTMARLLRFPFRAPDGHPMAEALLPGDGRAPPRLVVLLVWDGAGRNVLGAWPGAWPYLRSLAARGTWFERATVGASPSNTAVIHATMGTGAWPRRHGVAGEIRVDGRVTPAWELGPTVMLLPTLADRYDAALGDRPVVGAVATLAWHLGMLGHGAAWPGGDRDPLVLRPSGAGPGAEGTGWGLPRAVAPFFRFPAYVGAVGGFEEDLARLDRADGEADGRWRGNRLDDPDLAFDSPARIPYQTRIVEEVIRREGFGADAVPDLLFVNYKVVDEVGHRFTLNAPEMRDTLAAQDRALRDLVGFLDRRIGPGRFVLLVTADHGHTPDPEVTGAFRISVRRLEENLASRFDDADGVPVVQRVQPTHVYLDLAELAENGHTVDEVARYLLAYTKEMAAAPGVDVPEGERGERVFAAAFPASILSGLPCLPRAGGRVSEGGGKGGWR